MAGAPLPSPRVIAPCSLQHRACVCVPSCSLQHSAHPHTTHVKCSLVGEAPEMKWKVPARMLLCDVMLFMSHATHQGYVYGGFMSHSQWVFKLAVQQRLHYFAADSRDTMQAWIQTIGDCGAVVSVPSPKDVVLNSASSCVFTRLWINTDEAM